MLTIESLIMRSTQHNFLTEKLDEVQTMLNMARFQLKTKNLIACDMQLLKTMDYLEVVKDVMRIITMAEQQIDKEINK